MLDDPDSSLGSDSCLHSWQSLATAALLLSYPGKPCRRLAALPHPTQPYPTCSAASKSLI